MSRNLLIASIFSCTLILFVVVAVTARPEVKAPTVDSMLEKLVPEDQKIRLADGSLSLPKAVVDQPTFYFGERDPLQLLEHTFVIRNEGTADLKLTQGETTCKCTVSNLDQDTVPPGGYAHVVLQWNTGRVNSEYSHEAEIHTNDPARKTLHLRVEGKVRAQLGVYPDRLVFSRIRPGEPSSAKLAVFSQAWSEFEIEHVGTALGGVTWEVAPMNEEQRNRLAATSGFMLTVTLPNDLPEGYFEEDLTIRASDGSLPEDAEEDPAEIAVRMMGKVLRRLAIYGSGILQDGTLEFGQLQLGEGRELKLLVKLHDEEPRLQLTRYEADPDFLQVELTPYNSQDGENGLYRLTVRVPAEADVFRLEPGEMGTLKLEFDHPRVTGVTLPVNLTIDRKVFGP